MPGLYAAVDEETVDRIIRAESDRARFVAGLVVWRPSELRAEIERGAWYVLPPDAHLAQRKPSQGIDSRIRGKHRLVNPDRNFTVR